jgi:signal transduction histidine kinase/CheY-like chemotaxis protein
MGVWAMGYFVLPSLLSWHHIGNSVITAASVALVAVLVSYLESVRARAMETMRRAKESAEAANRAKDEFLAVLSHELRTPLTPALVAASGLASHPGLPADLRGELAMVRRNIELEARLIDDLLDLTRVTHGKLQLAREPLDLHALVGHVLEICQDDVRAKALEVRVELACERPYVNADPARLSQVLWNLLKNAIKFTPAGGRVILRSRSELRGGGGGGGEAGGRHVVIEVSDTGLGIDPTSLPRVFDAFEQGNRAGARQFGGLGLGRAISRAIAVAHGGELTAASEGAGRGATFTLSLLESASAAPPLVDPATMRQKSEEAPLVSDASVAARAVRVLLVEDHADTSRIIARLLEAMGYDVRVAEGVEEGLAAAAAGPFDLLISDIGLPDGSGLDLMRAVRQQTTDAATLPAIALSGYGMEEDVRRSRDAGFAAHLTKPVQFAALEAAIRKLSRPAAAEAAVSA